MATLFVLETTCSARGCLFSETVGAWKARGDCAMLNTQAPEAGDVDRLADLTRERGKWVEPASAEFPTG